MGIHKRTEKLDEGSVSVQFRPPPSVWHIRGIGTPINYTSMERARDFQTHRGSFMSLPSPGGKWWRWWRYQKKCEKNRQSPNFGFWPRLQRKG